MKRIFKFIAYFFLSLITFIILLIVVAKLAENKITDLALKKVSTMIDAPVTIDNVSFNLLRKFPLATIELDGVTLGSCCLSYHSDSTLYICDTLATIGKIYVSVKTKPLLKNEIEIIKVEVADTYFSYLVDTAGKTNFDFLMATDTTAVVEEPDTTPSAPLNLTLKELTLKNITVIYNDSSLKAKATITIPNITVNATALNDAYSATVKGNLKLSDCAFEGTNACLMKETEARFDLDYDNDQATIRDFTLITDGANLSVSGTALIKDTITTNLKINGTLIDLGELIKYAPAELLKEYGVNKVAGMMNLDATVVGNYADSTLLPQVTANITMNQGEVATKDYPALKNLSFDGKVTNGALANNQTTSATFQSFHVETGHSSVDMAFSVTNIDHPRYNVKTLLTIDIDDFKSFIPDSLVKSIDGIIVAQLSTKGQLPDSIGDEFTDYVMANSSANITLKNFNILMDSVPAIHHFSGQLVYEPNQLRVKNLGISIPEYKVHLKNTGLDAKFYGSVNRMQSMSVDLKSFHIETDSSIIAGSAKIKNLENPTYQFNSQINLNLAEIKTMMPDSIVDQLSGMFRLNIVSSGTINLDSIADQANDLVFNHSSFRVELKNLSVELPDSSTSVKNFSGLITMKSDTITMNKLSGSYSGIDFKLDSTEILNVYKAFMLGQPNLDLIVQTNIELGTIENAFIEAIMATDSVSTDSVQPASTNAPASLQATVPLAQNQQEINTTDSLALASTDTTKSSASDFLPDFKALGLPHFLIRGKCAIHQVNYGKNIIDDISLKFRFTDSLYVIDEFKLKTCGGEVTTSVLFDCRNWDQPKVDMKNIIQHLDLKQLLLVNDNFGDTTLTSDKVNGILTSELHARAFYVEKDWPTERIRVKGTFMLENGYLYNYQPLVDASIGIGGLNELDKMDFNTLKTSLFMLNDKIYIPKTDVVSSALDISAFAMQSMGEDYEYHLVLHLSDVLAGKSEKLMEEQAKQNKKDGGVVERSGLKLVSLKNGDKKKNGFDNENLRTKLEKTIQRQNSFLNLLFDPSLVNFSTDLDRMAKFQTKQE